MSSRGKYIVIEGLEGVGKTTMVQLVANQLMAAGLPVKVMREPENQNDLTARTIRHLTQNPQYPMNTRTEVLLYNAARSQSLEIIRQNIENGVICLVDRSYLTTLAIQYYGRGDVQDYQKINEIINFAVGDMQPDLMLVLDAPVETVKERMKGRYSAERFDNLDEAFLERVRAGYLWEAQQRNLPIVYATGTKDEVLKDIWKFVTATLAERNKASAASSTTQSVADVLAEKATTPPAHETPVIPVADPIKHEKTGNQSASVVSIPESVKKPLEAFFRQAEKRRVQMYDSLSAQYDEQVARLIASTITPIGADDSTFDLQLLPDFSKPSELSKDLESSFSPLARGISLVESTPRNEQDILAECLFIASDSTLVKAKSVIANWSYAKKQKRLEAALSKKGLELLTPSYVLDIVCTAEEYSLLKKVAGKRMQAQQFSPRLGYDTPKEIEKVNAGDLYDAAYDESLAMFSSLQAENEQNAAQLVLLPGHFVHCVVRLGIGELWSISHQADQNLQTAITQAISEAHPTVAKYLQPDAEE